MVMYLCCTVLSGLQLAICAW